MRGVSRIAVAFAAGLALADAGIVALALPPLLRELDTTVTGVAAVLAVYALVLAVALPAAAWVVRSSSRSDRRADSSGSRRGSGSETAPGGEGHRSARRFPRSSPGGGGGSGTAPGGEGHRSVLGSPRWVGAIGAVVFAAASLGCGLVSSLSPLLALRGAQAVGGAMVLVAAFALLRSGSGGGRLWAAAALLGTAAGPALGGALTEALGWRSIFLVQAPLALLTVPAFLALRPAAPGLREQVGGLVVGALPASVKRRHLRGLVPAAVSLLALSGALAAVLFLSVLLLVTGWSEQPLEAALAVSLLPLAAAAMLPVRKGSARGRALIGCLLVAGGTASLAFLPGAEILWLAVPQVVAGLGMGLALPALSGELLPERTTGQAAALLTARHVGIFVALAILAPVLTASLSDELDAAREQGAALILDAQLPPQFKLEFAPALASAVSEERPRAGLTQAFADRVSDVDAERLGAYDALRERTDDALTAAVDSAFAPGFLVGGGLGLLAAGAILFIPGSGRLRVGAGAIAAAALIALAVPVVYAVLAERERPPPVVIANPCQDRELPETGGIDGFLQDAALVGLDRVACRAGSSREELVLAMADDRAAEAYERRYDVDPRSLGALAEAALGL